MLKQLHHEDPKSHDAQRVANWAKFAKRKADPEDPDGEVFDEAALARLEAELLQSGGSAREIRLDESLGKKGESSFRRELKRYTTGSLDPLGLYAIADALGVRLAPGVSPLR